jgi:hypothetical protein
LQKLLLKTLGTTTLTESLISYIWLLLYSCERGNTDRFQPEVFACNMNRLKALGHVLVMLGGKFHQQHDRVWGGGDET